jgi:glycosyltransferase involved in cell wall biosynthesis
MIRVLTLARQCAERADISLLAFVRGTEEERARQRADAAALKDIFREIHLVVKETSGPAPEECPDMPGIAADWHSPEMAARVRELSPRFDVVHVEFLIMAFYARYVQGARKVLTEHDLSHLSLSRSYFREWSGPGRSSRIEEWRRVRRFHRLACSLYDRVVTLTPGDASLLRKAVPGVRAALIPTGVDCANFAFRPESEAAPDLDFVFVGHYPHFPNEDAALWFASRVLPLVRKVHPRASLALVGSSPTSPISALAGEGVTVTGTVPDVRPWLDRARVFVAPVRLGFGVKGKVLEAFARGRAVVATRGVARGLPGAVPGRHLLAADSPREFADACLSLLERPSRRTKLAAHGRAHVERRCDWSLSTGLLSALYEDLA